MSDSVRVPMCLLRQVCYPTSYRLPKLDRIIYPPPVEAKYREPWRPATTPANVHSPFQVHTRNGTSTYYPDRSKPVEDAKGNIPNDDYRYFIGTGYTQGVISNCRYCNVMCSSAQHRRQHINAGQCKDHLHNVYRQLKLGEAKCVVCGERTAKFTWGIRLCGPRCRNSFRFRNPPTLDVAIGTYTRGGK